MRSVPGVHWKDWCWSWNSNTLATWCEELTHWKRPWCWERMKAGGEGDDRGWDCWMASPTRWKWVWVGSREFVMGCCSPWGCRVGHDWETELNCTSTSTWNRILQNCLLKLLLFNLSPSFLDFSSLSPFHLWFNDGRLTTVWFLLLLPWRWHR